MLVFLSVLFTMGFQGVDERSAESLMKRHQAQLDRIYACEAKIETWRSRDAGRTWSRLSSYQWLKNGPSARQSSHGSGFIDPGGTYREQDTWHDAAYEPGQTRELIGWNPQASFRDEPNAANSYHGAAAVIAGTTNAGSFSGEPPYLMMLAATPADSLPELYRMASRPDAPRPVELGGTPLWTFRLQDSRFPNHPIYTIYVDPAKGYAIIRREIEIDASSASKPIRAVHEVMEFAEPEPGLYIPTRVRMSDPAEPDEIVEHRVEVVSVNRPIDEDRLRLAFPAGMKVSDLKEGTIHIWGNEGKPRLTFRDEGQLRSHEAASWGRRSSRSNSMIWPMLFGILALLLLLWFGRRRWIARMAS